jgi:hypothetical protein
MIKAESKTVEDGKEVCIQIQGTNADVTSEVAGLLQAFINEERIGDGLILKTLLENYSLDEIISKLKQAKIALILTQNLFGETKGKEISRETIKENDKKTTKTAKKCEKTEENEQKNEKDSKSVNDFYAFVDKMLKDLED